jgi:hypothetical protein
MNKQSTTSTRDDLVPFSSIGTPSTKPSMSPDAVGHDNPSGPSMLSIPAELLAKNPSPQYDGVRPGTADLVDDNGAGISDQGVTGFDQEVQESFEIFRVVSTPTLDALD